MQPLSQLSKSKYVFLMISLFIMLLMYPFFTTESLIGSALMLIVATIVPLAGVYALSHNSKIMYTAMLLSVPVIVLHWLNVFTVTNVVFYGSNLFTIIFYIFIGVNILIQIYKTRHVTEDTIFGSVSGYLLIGLVWAEIYSALYTSDPTMFTSRIGEMLQLVPSDFIYFSFVTITTLGYGDIVPATQTAQSFVVIEAVTGVFYVAILISRLVGLYNKGFVERVTEKLDE